MRCTIKSIARHKTFFLCCFFIIYITTFLSVEVLFGGHDRPSINLISYIQRYDDSSSDEYLLHVEAKLKRVVHENEEKKIDNDEGNKIKSFRLEDYCNIKKTSTGVFIYHSYCTVFNSFHDGGRYRIETSPLIFRANQWTGFYMITASAMKELKTIIVRKFINFILVFLLLITLKN